MPLTLEPMQDTDPTPGQPPSHAAATPGGAVSREGGRRKGGGIRRVVVVVILLALAAGAFFLIRERLKSSGKTPDRSAGAGLPVPVIAGSVVQKDVPIYLDGLGTVQALNTV